MRVLLVTLGYPKYPGEPTAPFIDGIAASLAARGHSIDVVLPFHPEFRHPETDSIRFYPYRYSPVRRFAPWGYGQTFGAGSRVRVAAAALLPSIALSARRCMERRLDAEIYDVIHAHWAVPNGWLAAPLARARRIPLAVTCHGSDLAMAERYRVLRAAAQRALANATAVTATSEQLSRRAISLGADPATTSTIYVGVDLEAFSPRPADPDLRRRFGASEGSFLVVSVGRLAEVKGFEYLVDAATQLDGVNVAIVGDGELRAKLDERARGSGGRVTLTGSLSHDRVADAMAAADVVVVPSVVDRAGRVDGTTSTVLEALASGRPLVATRVGGIPEIVRDGYNGLLVPEKDPRALAAAITRLQQDPTLSERLARQGRSFAVERLGWDVAARAFERLYEGICSPVRSREPDPP
jgi:glycosyltransferase involved in cell wall biosynthesis